MQMGERLLVKGFRLGLLSLFVGGAFAQSTTPPDPQASTNPLTLASGLLEHNFVNFYAYANGVYDTQSLPGSQSLDSWGEEFGGGITAAHQLQNGSLSLDYRGDYRNYQSSDYGSGTDQNLNFGINKQLSKRWTLSFYQAAGIFLYGGTYLSVQPVGSNAVSTNPFSPETKFLSSSLTMNYQYTRRLSFSISGNFFLNRYNYAGAIGTTGFIGTLSTSYRLTRHTSFGAGYSHNYYGYQQGAGNAQADNVYLFVSHQFRSNWNASLNAGVTRSNSAGTITIPVSFLADGQIISGYEVGHYNQTTIFPSFQGTLTHSLRHTQVSLTAGQGISSGNGFFLASRSDFANGFFSYTMRHSSLGIGGAYYRYGSVANTVTAGYTSASLIASYSINLARHFGTSLGYTLVYYPDFGGRSENRFTFGVFFSSKNVPLTLF